MNEQPQASRRWIPLGAAAALLGVSESTVRRWVDSGEVRSFRTRGGHRRVLEDDLRGIVEATGALPARDADRISDLAIARVRRRMSRGRQTHTMPTFAELSDAARDRLRLMGRQMVDLFARYISSSTRGERFVEDARTIGREYGRMLVAEKVRLTTAIGTFNSLRRSLDETASQIATESGLSTDEAVDAVERTLELADVVLEGMAEVYESSATSP
ncbi:helix-turn-helix domain-containing protein [bacterium]|nr:MAG: helix-turn-helix domain-containing protein [bacterium]MCL4231701.1 helix-turn-helix domain-containing protein [Dehalococcoidia bacterium]